MTKWPNDAIEGVKVHKVIPRPTALRAVGKNPLCFFTDCSTVAKKNHQPAAADDKKIKVNIFPAVKSYGYWKTSGQLQKKLFAISSLFAKYSQLDTFAYLGK
jgi:hypothetical protein